MDTREVTRNQPLPLSHEQQQQMAEIQALEADFVALCKRIGTSRELSVAVTNMEQAGMWALRHILHQ